MSLIDEQIAQVERQAEYAREKLTDKGSNPGSKPEKHWPKLDDRALYGLPGDFVKTVLPHTEADQVALLAQFLVAFGNASGSTPFYKHEDTFHRMNENALLVGSTSQARKGTSWDRVKNPFAKIDSTWLADRVMGGLSSGEGLIFHVRDPVKAPNKQTGRLEIVDAGVPDKRLLVIQPEFSIVLKVANRDGNTLSDTLRQAFDSGDLRIMNKNTPHKASGSHISIIGHVTQEELLRRLNETDIANGLANRFPVFLVRRSKELPEGGQVSDKEMEAIIQRLREAVEFSKICGELKRDEEARKLWRKSYHNLTQDKPGLLGAMTARAAAHVLRFSCIYALLDKSNLIRKEHLEAALALYKYCIDSVEYIFGDTLGDPVADTIHNALRRNSPQGMFRTALYELFGGHKKAHEINRALGVLLSGGNATCESVITDGRTAELWKATNCERSEESGTSHFIDPIIPHNSLNSQPEERISSNNAANLTESLE